MIISCIFLALFAGCLPAPTPKSVPDDSGYDTADSADTNGDTAGETEGSATDSGDSAADSAADTGEADPCDAIACERRLRDADGDGYGDPNDYLFVPPETAWEEGYVQWITGRDDCDDTDAAVHPDAAEVCNGIDDDCDTVIDEKSTWYADGDGDGYGDPAISVDACDQPAGYVANGDDCNDWNVEQNPSVTEYCNGADDDCDGVIPADEIDADGDGFNGCTASPDCDDTDPNVYPGHGC